MPGPHPSHKTRFSDASTFDEICVNCGATDEVPGGWGNLALPCPEESKLDEFARKVDAKEALPDKPEA